MCPRIEPEAPFLSEVHMAWTEGNFWVAKAGRGMRVKPFTFGRPDRPRLCKELFTSKIPCHPIQQMQVYLMGPNILYLPSC